MVTYTIEVSSDTELFKSVDLHLVDSLEMSGHLVTIGKGRLSHSQLTHSKVLKYMCLLVTQQSTYTTGGTFIIALENGLERKNIYFI